MEYDSPITDIVLYIGYFLVIVAVLAAIVMPLIKSLGDPKGLMKAGLGVVLLLVIFGISYALSSGDAIAGVQNSDLNDQGFKMVGGILITMYILLIIAVISIAVTEVAKFFR